jgi:glucan phosphoethanolaminetransferase (alkaline phosphatase superfamily)
MKWRLLLVYITVSAVIITCWAVGLHVPMVLAYGHVAVMLCVHAVVISMVAMVSCYRWVSLLLLGVYTVLLTWFYILIAGSMYLWGDIITLPMLGTYLGDLSAFVQSLPYNSVQLYALLAMICVIPLLGVWLLRHRVATALADHRAVLRSHGRVVWVVCLLALLGTPLLLRAKRVIHKTGEPLLVMLYDHMWGVTDNPLCSPHRVEVALRDRALRKAFRPHAIPRRHVILIIVDALRADHLSVYGYGRATSPYLQQLYDSHQLARADHCLATCACTLCGVPSILLSRTWEDCAIGDWSIMGLMHDYGYSTYAIISGAHRDWYNMAKFYSDDCTRYYDGKESKQYYFKDDRVLLEGLGQIPDVGSQTAMMYFHLQSTHETGLLLDTYAVFKPFKRSITATHLGTVSAINEYDNKVLQADDMIRQLMEQLSRKGYLKDALVVITADHGQGLGEHGVSGHVDWLYEPQLSVPLLIYDDSLARYRQLHLARQIDIAPTIADRLGMQIPASWMGRSLLQDTIAPISYHTTGKTQLETGIARYALIWHTAPHIYKYIYTLDRKQEELYDIAIDAAEILDLKASQPAVITRLRAESKLAR